LKRIATAHNIEHPKTFEKTEAGPVIRRPKAMTADQWREYIADTITKERVVFNRGKLTVWDDNPPHATVGSAAARKAAAPKAATPAEPAVADPPRITALRSRLTQLAAEAAPHVDTHTRLVETKRAFTDQDHRNFQTADNALRRLSAE